MSELAEYTHVFRADIRSANAQRRVYKRTRFPVACVSCRNRKAKCDKVQPACGACVKRGEGTTCKYSPTSTFASAAKVNESSPGDKSEGGHPTPARGHVAIRLQQLERLVNELVTSNRPAAESGTASSQTVQETPEPARYDGDVNASSTKPLFPEARQSSSASGGSPARSPESSSQPVGHLSNQGRFVGATHWEAVLESIHDLQVYLEENDSNSSPEESSPARSEADGPCLLFGSVDDITIQDVFDALPPRSEADALLTSYFQDKFSASPLLHVPRFRREYEAFWKAPHEVDFLWISILFSLLSTAATIKAAKEDRPYPQRFRFMRYGVRCLMAGEYLTAKPLAVEALMIHALSRIADKGDHIPDLWSIFSLATRLAQRMGYHRDPVSLTSSRNTHITPFEAEMRRRTWFAVEAFDLMYSFQLGMPAIVNEAECDVQAPSNLADEDFDEHMEVLPPPRPETELTPILYFRHKSRLIRLLRRLGQHALRIDQPDYSATLELDAALRATYKTVPPDFRYLHIQDIPFTDFGYHILQRISLEIMHLKAMCVLHRPFLTFRKEDPMYALSRKECREAAVRIMEVNAELVEALAPGGRLYPERHLLANITLHDFLLGAMILCLDLNESDLEPADRARKLAILQKAYNTWSKHRHMSPEAQHATNVLGAMLKKVALMDTDTSVRPSTGTVPTVATVLPESAGTGSLEKENDAVNISVTSQQPEAGVSREDIRKSRSSTSQPSSFLLAGCSGPATGSGFSSADVFDFADWNAEAPIGNDDAGFMDTDVMPLDSFISDPNNLDWNLIDSYLLNQNEPTVVAPASTVAPTAPAAATEDAPIKANQRLNIYY
ncbi:hypothetical protein GQ53DRAFT_872480 [Thozetella sp. PMI_491]|nr:hypothetical protein GQ53DRAFT_872480 [Thozetella sp. PMI_491]